MRWSLTLLLTVGLGCGTESAPDVSAGLPAPPAADLVPETGGKADGSLFDANRLIADDLFEDFGYLTVGDVQGFFEETPYGTRSFLAGFAERGHTAAEILVDAATRYRVNPLVLLVKLQVETSMVFATDPSTHLDRAMGCACPDNSPCSIGHAGFTAQMECAAEHFRSYLDQLDGNGETQSGWKVGVGRISSDGVAITPKNRATAALYTYTPWVLVGAGGNWLFWNVMRKFSRHVL